ncbi:TonB-dependent receptor [Hymenobacter montanus]|uniref:TonB-dependent receptor n=1 Tax=Hymenobacter montanus TaxID=2771359 RepID=UPI00168BE3B6|nr:TonB-dependent receptor [Hymenobacter montanus]
MALTLALPLKVWAQARVAGPETLAGTIFTGSGVELPGATVFLKGTFIGTSTNAEGRFSLQVPQFNPPVTLVVSFMGYITKEVELSAPSMELSITLEPSPSALNEVVVAASRVEEAILRAPVTIEKVSRQQLEKIATPEILGGLGQFKGIDVNSASMLFTSVSTRGFNTAKSERIVQLFDYADMQLPSLSLSPGNMVGIPELDMESIEIVHGPASALYGSNALNGVVLFNSKDPFTYTGLSARLRGGQRDYFDGQLRYAVRLSPKVALKFNGSLLSAKEWIADDYSASSNSRFPTGSPRGWDAINRYGDIILADNNPANPELYRFGVQVPGFTERELLANDDHTRSYRVMGTLAYLIRDDLKLTVEAKRAVATSTYQNFSRFRLRDFGTNQFRAELKNSRGFLRVYSTQDFSGQSYELESLAGFLATSRISDDPSIRFNYAEQYMNDYINAYYQFRQNQPSGSQPQNQEALAAARAVADAQWQQRAGSARIQQQRESIIANDVLRTGSRIRFGSFMYDASLQYRFALPFELDLTTGGAYREYRLGSEGRYFSDTPGNRIRNYEYGAYAQLTKPLLDQHLKLAVAGRVDNFQNFDAAFSPRASAVVSLGAKRQHNFRLNYSSAFRAPSAPEQYYAIDLPRYFVSGNLTGFRGYSFLNVDPATGRPEVLVARNPMTGQLTVNPRSPAFEQAIDPLRLERVGTFEIGYRGMLFDKLDFDGSLYWSRYNDFVGATNILSNVDGSRPTTQQLTDEQNYQSGYTVSGSRTRFVYAWVNNPAPVDTRGATVGAVYYWMKQLNISANYTYSQLTNEPRPYGAFNLSSFFNTPTHKYNVGANGLLARNLSYSANYRWVEGHFQEMPFANGNVKTYSTIDAQLDYSVPRYKSTLQLGVSNLLDGNNVQIVAGPKIGRLAFLGLLVDVK